MAQVQNPTTLDADAATLLNPAAANVGPDGVCFTFTITGTNSLVLSKNTAPPGATPVLVDVAYLNGSLALQSAGTAITATGLAYVSPDDAALDLWATLNWTSGAVVSFASAANLGAGGGGGSGGPVSAGDVTAGTFGQFTGSTGDYAFPDDVTVADDLTAADVIATATISGPAVTFSTLASSTTALATPSALAATALNTFASTVSGATLMGFGTTHDVTLKNRAGTSVLGVTANTSDVTAAGAIAAAGVISNTATSASLAQSTTTAAVNVGTGTGSGGTTLQIRGAAGQTRTLRFTTGASTGRWDIAASSGTESGANAGSNFNLIANDDAGAAIDTPLTIVRAANGEIYTAAGRSVTLGGAPAAAATVTRNRKATTAIADNVATTVCTITVPNAAHSAVIKLTALGVLGAGGAIGAGECNASNSYDITIVRTAGVAAVADISAAYGVNAAAVAGATTCTAVITVGAVGGAVGDPNTFAVQITIVKAAGSSDNHTALVRWEIVNQNATGITVA